MMREGKFQGMQEVFTIFKNQLFLEKRGLVSKHVSIEVI